MAETKSELPIKQPKLNNVEDGKAATTNASTERTTIEEAKIKTNTQISVSEKAAITTAGVETTEIEMTTATTSTENASTATTSATTTTTSAATTSTETTAAQCNLTDTTTAAEKSPSNSNTSDAANQTNHQLQSKEAMQHAQTASIARVLSNLYLNATVRLQLRDPPRCARDLSYCHQQHYHALLPNAPDFSQAKGLRAALMQQVYLTFLEFGEMMCTRTVFPGDGVMTKILEMLLVVVPKNIVVRKFQMIYTETIKLFRLMVCVFPPCWLALRPYYVNLFDVAIGLTGREKKEHTNSTSKPKKIVPLLFDLLESNLNECTTAELSTLSYAHIVDGTEEGETHESSDEDDLNSMTMSEIMNCYDWQDDKICLDNFYTLRAGKRLARIFDALELLLHVLERDTVMWLLHHHKKIRKFMFDYEKCPLMVLVCAFTEQTRVTSVVKQLFTLYATAAAKELHKKRLQILERYIALLMEISNTADLEYTDMGYKYPALGRKTKHLIRELFITFKACNPTHIGTYVQTMSLLRQPYVCYEFTDHFLQLFYFPKNEVFTPKKVAYELLMKRSWRKYKTRAELNGATDALCREDYLKLLLNALCAYCNWHGSQKVFKHFKSRTMARPLQTVTESLHRQRLGSGNRLLMQRIERDIAEQRKKLKTQVIVSMPKVDLPAMDICVDSDVNTQYRNDLKFMTILAEQLPRHQAMHADVDFGAWLPFLQPFHIAGDDVEDILPAEVAKET